MKEAIFNYVQGQIAQAPYRLKGHITDPAGKTYPQRHIYKKLERHLDNFLAGKTEQRWIIVPGLRGVGKTTVLSQLFLKLQPRFDSLRTLYVSLDEATGLINSNLLEILEAYESILGESFERAKKPIFLFIDEVQYDPKWGLALKSLYDRTKQVFIFCTGSSAVSLQTNPDVYRRVVVEKLYPLSFPEYQMLHQGIFPAKGLKSQIKQAVYFSSDSHEVYENSSKLGKDVLQYWSRVDKLEIQQYLMLGTLPFALQFFNPTQVYETIGSLLDKIIQKDIENLKSFDPQTLQAIKRLLFLLADTGDILSVAKLPALTGIESSITTQKVLAVLEQAELLIRVFPYGSHKSRLTKPSKYLFMSPAIRMALLGIVGKEATFYTRMGKLLEDAAAMHFSREFISSGVGAISYDGVQGGADFILQIANKKQIAIEIGVGEKDRTQVKKTMERIQCDYGIVIGDGKLTHFPEDKVIYLPLSYFLLM